MLFKKRRMKREEDRVWAKETYKFAGICDEVLEKMNAGQTVFAVAHFSKTLDTLREAVDARKVEYTLIEETWDMGRLDIETVAKGQVFILPSALIPSPRRIIEPSLRKNAPAGRVHVIIAEHYPVPERDGVILAYASSLPFMTTVRFHASMDEPLLRAFGGDRTFGLLARFGWRKNEPISNHTLTSAIASGQSRIERIANSDEKVNSAEEWFYYNCPLLRDRLGRNSESDSR
jgi:hypothetical protein